MLFSTPYENENFAHILKIIFPIDFTDKRALFMPSQGISNANQKYLDDWIEYSKSFNAKLEVIDNLSQKPKKEIEALQQANILIISGGDPFQLLINLRDSGLDEAIIKFTQKDDFILAGYSAGAFVLTPSLEVAKILNMNYPSGKKYISQEQLEDFSGLGIVDFEVFPHFQRNIHQALIDQYRNVAPVEVKPISDSDYLFVDL